MSEKTEEKRIVYSDYVKDVANMFIDKMKEGQVPWQMGWEKCSMWPQSAVTRQLYHGMNCLWLWIFQDHLKYKDPRWITLKQAAKLGGRLNVEKKLFGVPCVYFAEVRQKKDDIGSEASYYWDKKNGKKRRTYGRIPCFFLLFNVELFEGLKIGELEPKHEWNPIEKAEKLVKATGAKILHEISPAAYYDPILDEIHLPLKKQFFSPEHYYDTLLHETGHWTGHETRLNRPMKWAIDRQEYAKEELRVEIASAMLGATLGIPHNIENQAAYLQSWIKVLEDDPKEIFKAAADAEKIKDFIISKDPELMELYGKPKKAKNKQEEMKNRSE